MAAASNRRIPLQKAPRTVIGYHGCSREAADRILSEERFLEKMGELSAEEMQTIAAAIALMVGYQPEESEESKAEART